MKHIYESFEEIADEFTDGEYLAHELSDHGTNVCEIWQTSIKEFAKALDLAGFRVEGTEEHYDRFWERVTESLKTWKAGLNRRKPFRKKIGELSLDEAQQRYNYNGKIGGKLIVPNYPIFGESSEDYYDIVD